MARQVTDGMAAKWLRWKIQQTAQPVNGSQYSPVADTAYGRSLTPDWSDVGLGTTLIDGSTLSDGEARGIACGAALREDKAWDVGPL